jgi:hypothetical protein
MMASSLIKKLRIQPGQRMLVLNAPQGYVSLLGELPAGAELLEAPEGPFDFVQLFVKDRGEFAAHGPAALAAVKYDGLLWVCYPKKSAGVPSDLSRDAMWELLAGSGWRPVAQVSIDEVWSAVRFRPEELVGT